MSFETVGTVHKIFETQSKSETFRTREFVIKQEGQYPQFIKFQLTQDRCDIVESHQEGDKLKVFFDLRGREWNEKYFTNLNAWKVEKVSDEVSEGSSAPPVGSDGFDTIQEPQLSGGSTGNKAEDFDDLPF